MKFVVALTFFLLTYLSPLQSIPYSELEVAVQTVNVNKIVSYGTDKILVSINNKESIYSKSQASIVLKDFFSKKPVQNFKITIKSQTKGNVSFAAGEYQCKTGKYRVSFQFKQVDDTYKIDKIVISEL